MLFPSSLASCLALCSLLGAAIAAPSPSPAADLVVRKENDLKVKDKCQVVRATVYALLSVDTPHAPTGSNEVHLERRNGFNSRKTAMTFEGIPPGATGCMLTWDSPEPQHSGQYGDGPSVTVDVWSTAPWSSRQLPTYANPPPKNQMVSTFNVPVNQGQKGFHTVLVSSTCSPTMSFLLEYSSWQKGDGRADWADRPGVVGFSMVFNC
ncbi:hypothetical protein GX51_04853 [Blastomyces parvus]|uniref:Ubiquitin 3 binding protein But2 C-terminal domain-containing protein n=1 Tax=Blastomyces parvus TaxID=2060905 RepID=A0A2B7WZS5_9EURO|nr:hypothetical protein GX51_04853 [Blastomyces parvus]